nr:AHS alpha [Viridiscus perviridis]WPK49527.1 AHS alpha [Viridiscus sp. 1 JF-2023a]
MNYALVAALCAALVGCAFALQLPHVKDQERPIDPKQIKNATLAFYNNGTYIYMLEVPCDAYLGRGGSSSQQSAQQRAGQSPPTDEDEEEDHDDEDANGQQQQTPQQRQRQQMQQRQRQQQQRGGRSSSSQSSEHHLSGEELRQAHEGTECECQCKGHDGETLEDVVKVTFGGQSGMSSSSRSGQRGAQSQQQRSQQQRLRRQQQQQRGGSSSGHDEEGPELVYPQQPRAGQKCIFFEEGEWENDDDGESKRNENFFFGFPNLKKKPVFPQKFAPINNFFLYIFQNSSMLLVQTRRYPAKMNTKCSKSARSTSNVAALKVVKKFSCNALTITANAINTLSASKTTVRQTKKRYFSF